MRCENSPNANCWQCGLHQIRSKDGKCSSWSKYDKNCEIWAETKEGTKYCQICAKDFVALHPAKLAKSERLSQSPVVEVCKKLKKKQKVKNGARYREDYPDSDDISVFMCENNTAPSKDAKKCKSVKSKEKNCIWWKREENREVCFRCKLGFKSFMSSGVCEETPKKYYGCLMADDDDDCVFCNVWERYHMFSRYHQCDYNNMPVP